jgi:hypothetical protein
VQERGRGIENARQGGGGGGDGTRVGTVEMYPMSRVAIAPADRGRGRGRDGGGIRASVQAERGRKGPGEEGGGNTRSRSAVARVTLKRASVGRGGRAAAANGRNFPANLVKFSFAKCRRWGPLPPPPPPDRRDDRDCNAARQLPRPFFATLAISTGECARSLAHPRLIREMCPIALRAADLRRKTRSRRAIVAVDKVPMKNAERRLRQGRIRRASFDRRVR